MTVGKVLMFTRLSREGVTQVKFISQREVLSVAEKANEQTLETL